MSETFQQLTAPNSLPISQPIGLFINNEFVKSTSGNKFATINPAYDTSIPLDSSKLTGPSNEQEITSVYAADPEDVDIAVKAARKALKHPSWKDLSSSDRGKLLLRLADLVEENAHVLATIETWDNGRSNFHAKAQKWGVLMRFRKTVPTCSQCRCRRHC